MSLLQISYDINELDKCLVKIFNENPQEYLDYTDKQLESKLQWTHDIFYDYDLKYKNLPLNICIKRHFVRHFTQETNLSNKELTTFYNGIILLLKSFYTEYNTSSIDSLYGETQSCKKFSLINKDNSTYTTLKMIYVVFMKLITSYQFNYIYIPLIEALYENKKLTLIYLHGNILFNFKYYTEALRCYNK